MFRLLDDAMRESLRLGFTGFHGTGDLRLAVTDKTRVANWQNTRGCWTATIQEQLRLASACRMQSCSTTLDSTNSWNFTGWRLSLPVRRNARFAPADTENCPGLMPGILDFPLEQFEIVLFDENTCWNFAPQDDPIANLAVGKILYLIDLIRFCGSDQSNPIA